MLTWAQVDAAGKYLLLRKKRRVRRGEGRAVVAEAWERLEREYEERGEDAWIEEVLDPMGELREGVRNRNNGKGSVVREVPWILGVLGEREAWVREKARKQRARFERGRRERERRERSVRERVAAIVGAARKEEEAVRVRVKRR